MEAVIPISETESSLAALFEDASGGQEIVVAMARNYLVARRFKEDKESEEKLAGEKLRQAESDLLRAMDQAGVKSLAIDDDGKTAKLSQTQSTYYSLPAGAIDDEGVMQWLNEAGAKDIIKRTIHHATFSSFCKELADMAAMGGLPLHPSVKIAEKRGIQLRKG